MLILVACDHYSSWTDTVSPSVYATQSKRTDSAPARSSLGDAEHVAEHHRLETHLGTDWRE